MRVLTGHVLCHFGLVQFLLSILCSVCVEAGTDSEARGFGTECSTKDTTFELWTGFVYTSPDDLIDTRSGVLLLQECVELCRGNVSCQSVNYETGLCVLFSSNADQKPGGIARSDYPVFTHYLQKVCMGSVRTTCRRPWAFERLREFRLAQYTKRTLRVDSKDACLQMCLHERQFACRSASFSASLGQCALSEVDRFSLTSDQKLRADPRFDYYESNCVEEPVAVCRFEPLQGQILKTVDAVYQDVESRAQCQTLCQSAEFRCHTYDYGAAGAGVCRLSHHASDATLRHIRQPYLAVSAARSWQRQSCYNVTLQCDGRRMLASVRTGRIFNGKIYARGSPNSCVMDVKNQMTANFELGYQDLDCDVKQIEPGVFVSDIIIQHHDKVVTGEDVGLSLRCVYALGDTKVHYTAGLSVNGSVASAGHQATSVRSPNISMSITDRNGTDIATAQVGDALALRFEVQDADSPYQILVRHLVAQDGGDSAEIELLDQDGCPTDPTIMGAVSRVGDSPRLLHVPFAAFKFPSSGVVQFKALVTPCLPRCRPASCSVLSSRQGTRTTVQSYGRRRRRRQSEKQVDEEILVVKRIHIVDTFPFPDGQNGEDTEEEPAGKRPEESMDRIRGSIGSHTWQYDGSETVPLAAIAGSCAGLLVLQLLVVGAWRVVQRKRVRSRDSTITQESSVASTSSQPW